MPQEEKLSPAERVTRAIEAALKRGVRPWAPPWRDGAAGVPLLPRRANGAPYRGVNVVALWAIAAERGYERAHWLTYKQAVAMGGQVRKGETGAFVVFYKPLQAPPQTERDASAEMQVRRVLRGYVVFNHAQIDGLDADFAAGAPAILVNAPNDPSGPDVFAPVFSKPPALVRFGGTRAFYAPAIDAIQMPPRDAFVDRMQFYATLAHELSHWTGHPTRLNRDFGDKRFGGAGYALEELVAELSAAFMGAVLGLPSEHIEDHASYIESWLGVLQDNRSAFLTAAAKAQAAADYLLDLMGAAPASAAPAAEIAHD